MATVDPWAQRERAFRLVQAYALLERGEPIATVAVKLPVRSGGRAQVYLAWHRDGQRLLVRGAARDPSTDAVTASMRDAAKKLRAAIDSGPAIPASEAAIYRLLNALDGPDPWERAARRAELDVVTVI